MEYAPSDIHVYSVELITPVDRISTQATVDVRVRAQRIVIVFAPYVAVPARIKFTTEHGRGELFSATFYAGTPLNVGEVFNLQVTHGDVLAFLNENNVAQAIEDFIKSRTPRFSK